MAAEADIDAADAGGDKPRRKLPLAIVIAAVVVLAAGAGAYFLFFSAPKQSVAELHKAPESFIFNLPTMMVNLNSEGQGESFMKLTVALEVASQSVMLDIQPRMAKVVDAFQVYLRELRKSDLQGSEGIYRLKEELRRRVNVAIFPAQVDSILFKEILVQ